MKKLIVSSLSKRKGRYMRTHLTVPQIKDYIIVTIIIKSKFILRKSDLDELLQKSGLGFASDLIKSDSRTISFRPEELQELINEIRRNIGDVGHRDGLVKTNFIADNERISKDFEVICKNNKKLQRMSCSFFIPQRLTKKVKKYSVVVDKELGLVYNVCVK